MSLYRIGVDVGGTNTDAAILDMHALNQPSRGVLASHKAPTTPDITSGIEAAIAAVLKSSAVDQRRVLSVTIGTTHFINALIEADARRLDRVAVVRLCGPFTRQIPPFSGFPVGLHGVLDGGAYYLDGGLEMDGRHMAPLREEQVRAAARDIVASGVGAVAVVGVFSPLDHDDVYEKRCRAILRDEAPALRVVCSQDIGPTGFVERENATILNAAILRTGHRVKNGFKRAVRRLGLACPLYLSQNDGTLIDAETAADFPIKTFASGPTNSMSGAAFLAGLDRHGAGKGPVVNGVESKVPGVGDAPANDAVEPQVLVVDIGGTTTDVCALLPSGFPRQAPGFVEVAGVRTAFSIPEVVSIGLGGGSKVTADPDSPQSVSVGPGSVGHELLSQAKVFGGPTLTATDIVVAEGRASLGDASLVKDVAGELREGGRRGINALLESVIDKMKVSTAPVHVLLVGGGSILVTEEIAGVDKCIEPIHQGAANAVGAAIGKISGEVDTVEILEGRDEKAVIAAACQRAVDQAVAKGARPDDVKIVEVNKMPLQYMSQVTIRIQVRAVGTLAIPDDVALFEAPGSGDEANGHDDEQDEGEKVGVPNALHPTTKPSLGVDLATYRPDVRGGTWYPSDIDLELISTGCAILGTGGGGPTYYEYLKSLQCLSSNDKGRMRIVSPKSLRDDAVVCLGTWYGSPSVINERIAAGNEIVDAIKAVNRIQHIETFDAVLADEIGGGNGLSALPVGAYFDVPVLDCDGMGRAYPTMYHITFSVYGHEMTPAVITDARGNAVVAMGVDSAKRLETICRNAAVELGLSCACGTNPISGAMAKSVAVPNTLSQSWYLGRAVHQARRAKTSYTDAIFAVCAGRVLFTGKIVDVQRHLDGGYTMGAVVLAPFAADERDAESKPPQPNDSHMIIPFQNEYLYAALCDEAGSPESQQVVATVPELISILGHDGEAIGSQDLRFGLRVSVIALPAHPLWKTDAAMAIGGPAGFGLKMDPVDGGVPFTEPRSVIDEFNV
ncbi:putative hydantoinase/oxoprolinase [Metarhizium anisopliae]